MIFQPTVLDVSGMTIEEYFDFLDSLGTKAPRNSLDDEEKQKIELCLICHNVCQKIFASFKKGKDEFSVCSKQCYDEHVRLEKMRRAVKQRPQSTH